MTVKENPPTSNSSHGGYANDAPYLIEIQRRRCPSDDAQPDAEASPDVLDSESRLYCNNGENATVAVVACVEYFMAEFPDTLPHELEFSVKLVGPEGPKGPCSDDLRHLVNAEAVKEKVLMCCTCPKLPVFEYTAFFSDHHRKVSAWATIQARGVTHAFSMIVSTLESIGAWSLFEPFPAIDLFSGYQPPLKGYGSSLPRMHSLREDHLEGAPVAIEEGSYVGPGYTHLSYKTGFALTDDIPCIPSEEDEEMNVLLQGKHRQRNADVIPDLFNWELGAVGHMKTYIHQPQKEREGV